MARANNGRRADVRFGNFSGPAGVVERGGETTVALVATQSMLGAAKGGTIDGVSYRLVKVTPSEVVDGMIVLTVEPSA